MTLFKSNVQEKIVGISQLHNICKNMFACLFTVHNTISLSRHEQVCLTSLRFEKYFSHHPATQMIMSHIFKGNMQTWTEIIKLKDKKKLCNVTN